MNVRLLVAALCTAAAVLAADPATASFRFAKQTLTVPAGFIVEEVAGPPQVNRPISAAFDPEGRLYVTDSSGLSEKASVQLEQSPHRIVRLDAAGGDGRFGRATTFADRMMFPQGALFREGSFFVAAPPRIWKLTDTDGDGVADRREVWYDGLTLTGCANDLHGPYLGPDGWMYWTKGAFAEQTHRLPDGGTLVSKASHIFRARPDGSLREPVLTGGMDNPVGLAFTATGDRILSGTFFQIGVPGRRDGLIHAIPGGVYGKEQPALDGHPRSGDLMPIMTHLGPAAPCGSTVYQGRAFGAEFDGNLFLCSFNLRKVTRHVLEPDGATYRTVDSDFVTSDHPDFRPTDVLEDADGSLLVVDTGGWYKICCPTSQLAKPDVLGAIYRIRRAGAPRVDDPRGLSLRWKEASAAELAERLADVRPAVAERAMEELGRRGGAALPALGDRALTSSQPEARRRAVFTLARIDHPEARVLVRRALADPDHDVLRAALEVTSLWRDPGAADALIALLARSEPDVVRLAAEALGRARTEAARTALLQAASRLSGQAFTATGTPAAPGGRVQEHALIAALAGLGQPGKLRAELGRGSPRQTRVLLVVLDQWFPDELQAADVVPFLGSSEDVLRSTAGWIAGRRPAWGDALAAHYGARLRSGSNDEDLVATLGRLAAAPALQRLLADVAGDAQAQPEARRMALQAMAGATVKAAPAPWLDRLSQLLGERDPWPAAAVATAARMTLPSRLPPALAQRLAGLGRDEGRDADLRLAALAVRPAELGPLEPALFAFLVAQVDARQTLSHRTAATTVLARAPLTPEQQLVLADALRTVAPGDAPRLLPAFERGPTEALGRRLLAALADSPARAGLRGPALPALLARFPASLQPDAAALLASVSGRASRTAERIEELLPAVARGDVRRGQAVFNAERTACRACHQMGYGGGRFGPDLTAIGRIRDERELLEAIIDPSATFVRGYEPMTATLVDGTVQAGLLRHETADEVILATGPDSEVRLPRGRLTSLEPSTVSPMPPGIDTVLTAQEVGDLVAFLRASR